MKAQIISRINVALLFLLTAGISFAQTEHRVLSPAATPASKVKVSEKMQTQFHKLFSEASDVKWYDRDNNFVAIFSMNEQDHHTLFTKKGGLIYHIIYGFEKDLPAETRKLIKSVYYDYKIISAIKVEENGRNIWVVNMEDEKSIVTVRVEDGEMEEVKKLQKSS
jgi:hypothetical protein